MSGASVCGFRSQLCFAPFFRSFHRFFILIHNFVFVFFPIKIEDVMAAQNDRLYPLLSLPLSNSPRDGAVGHYGPTNFIDVASDRFHQGIILMDVKSHRKEQIFYVNSSFV